MSITTTNLELDVLKKTTIEPIVAKQNDVNSRFIVVQITENKKPITVSTREIASINIRRPDGKGGAYSGTINGDGTITVPLPAWALELDGLLECDVSVSTGDDRLTTTMFQVYVEPASYTDSDIIRDEQYSLLTDLIARLERVSSELHLVDNVLVTSATLNNNNLVVGYSDGTQLNVPIGGTDIIAVEFNSTGELVFRRSDNTEINAGAVPIAQTVRINDAGQIVISSGNKTITSDNAITTSDLQEDSMLPVSSKVLHATFAEMSSRITQLETQLRELGANP